MFFYVLIVCVVGGFITGMMFRSRTPLSVTSFGKKRLIVFNDLDTYRGLVYMYIIFPSHNVIDMLIKKLLTTHF